MSPSLRSSGRVRTATSDHDTLPPAKKLKTRATSVPSSPHSAHDSSGTPQVNEGASEGSDEQISRNTVDANFGYLSKLPAEIRLMIYKATFDELSTSTQADAKITIATDERMLVLPFGFIHPLLKLNAAMYREAGDIFFRNIIYHCRFDMSQTSSSNVRVDCPAWKDGLTFMRRDEEPAVIGILVTPTNVQSPNMHSLTELGSPFSRWKHMREDTIFLPMVDAANNNFASSYLNGLHTTTARPRRFVAILPPPNQEMSRRLPFWHSSSRDVADGCIELMKAAAARPWNSRLRPTTQVFRDVFESNRLHLRSYLGWCARQLGRDHF